MDSPSIVDLAKKFNDSSNKLKDLIQNLSILNSTLQKMDKSVDTMSEFKQVLIDNNLVRNLEAIISTTDKQYKEIEENMEKISQFVNNFENIKNSFNEKIDLSAQNLLNIKTEITDFNVKIYPSINDIKNQLKEINTFNYVEISTKLISQLNSIQSSIFLENKKIISNLQNFETKYSDISDKIKILYEKLSDEFDKTSLDFSMQFSSIDENLVKIFNTNIELSEMASLLSSKNDKIIEYFFNLCDQWAQNSVKPLALKKKNGSIWNLKK